MTITITEALAELRTITARLESKRGFVTQFLSYPDVIRDPLEKEGGSIAVIQREFQSIGDLEKRILTLRTGINAANSATMVTVGSRTMTIAEWIVWKRDVAPKTRQFLHIARKKIQDAREGLRSKAIQVGVNPAQQQPAMIVNIDEHWLAKQAEEIETILGGLDGQLSLKNATVFVNDL